MKTRLLFLVVLLITVQLVINGQKKGEIIPPFAECPSIINDLNEFQSSLAYSIYSPVNKPAGGVSSDDGVVIKPESECEKLWLEFKNETDYSKKKLLLIKLIVNDCIDLEKVNSDMVIKIKFIPLEEFEELE